MCGLVGAVGRVPPAQDLVCAMRDTLVHRGPDDTGAYFDGQAALGFRRLSIIDVSSGHQPMANEDESVWVVLNGEIYNFPELREDLESKGHRFATRSDTECLVHGYEEYGDGLLSRLNGMFAIALWDRPNRRLLLARDRAGEKPLHYSLVNNGMVFGSEIKALLQHPSVSSEMDWAAFDEFMSFGYIAAPRSIYRHIKKVPPGHYLVYQSGQIRVQRYWELDLNERFLGTFEDATEECVRLMNDAVRMRLVSDVPLGAFLSGGIDSSAVVAFMAKNSTTPVRTFSIGFDQPGYDETHYADLIAKRYGTDNTRLIVTPDYKDRIEDILLNFDEPFGDSSALPTYLVSSLTRRHVTVALSGDGGDELFGGYITYSMLLRLSKLLGFIPEFLKPVAGRLAELLPSGSKIERRLRFVGLPESDRFLRMITHFRRSDKEDLYAGDTKSHISEEEAGIADRRALLAQGERSYSDRMQYADLMRYLPDDILVKVDRTSMLVSLETRAPFLDHRLMEFAFSLPSEWKISPNRSKIILREALKSLLPAEIIGRGKWGFSVPLRQWFAGPLYEFCRTRVLQNSMDRFFTRSTIGRLLDEHRNGRRDHSTKLWLLLCFALWAAKNGYES